MTEAEVRYGLAALHQATRKLAHANQAGRGCHLDPYEVAVLYITIARLTTEIATRDDDR